ncbi:MAG TPA: aminopeptidase P N-terminal domain-containing protein [Gemmatimonadaceae bacterium]|nr:aminopeptidase P N-terminal domain-containing protein [Gemmatimonadaceae bacterium]
MFLALSMSARAQGSAPAATTAPYATRIERTYRLLGKDLVVVRSTWAPATQTAPAFEQEPNFYYFTGSRRLLGAVLVLDGGTGHAEIFLPPQPPAARPWWTFFAPQQPMPEQADAAGLHVDRVSDWSAFAPYVARRLADDPGLTIRVDDGGTASQIIGALRTPLDSAAVLANPYRLWLRSIQQRWPSAHVVSDGTLEALVRSIKDSSEIAILRRVAGISVSAFLKGLGEFSPGRRQRDVEAAVVDACLRLGDGPSFWPWAMSGPDAAFPIPFTSFVDDTHLDRVMRAGEIARFDIGCAADHYKGDVGRTVPVGGRFSSAQRETVDLLVDAYRAGLGALHDGATSGSVIRASIAAVGRRQTSLRTPLGREAAMIIAREGGIPFWQIHGIGLSAAEELPDTLRAGMVLDYEPIFVVDGEGFFMEDMVLVTRNGFEILTKGLPYSAAEIERAMRRAPRRRQT